jgi:hypothetical protein
MRRGGDLGVLRKEKAPGWAAAGPKGQSGLVCWQAGKMKKKMKID